MRLLANENIPSLSISKLEQQGFDVKSIGGRLGGIQDREVLQMAVDEARVLITFDRDYGHLIYKLGLPVPPGVIYIRLLPESPQEPADLILELLELDIPLEGRFTVLDRERVRQRTLPA